MAATAAPIKHPDAEVQITGQDADRDAIIQATAYALRKAGASAAEIAAYRAEADAGSYQDLLDTTARWVTAL